MEKKFSSLPTLELEINGIRKELNSLRVEKRLEDFVLSKLELLLSNATTKYKTEKYGNEKLFIELDKLKIKIVTERLKRIYVEGRDSPNIFINCIGRIIEW